MPILFLQFVLISGTFAQYKDPNTPFSEVIDTLPESEKNWMFYFVILLFVLSTVTATLLTASFLIMAVFLWNHLKPMKFFWFLLQLTISAFILSTLNLVFNVPATLFSVATEQFVQTNLYLIMSYVIDFCLHSILFSNFVMAIQRFAVFFHLHISDIIFESPYIYIWLVMIYVLPSLTLIFLGQDNCMYRFDNREQKFTLTCFNTVGTNKVKIEIPRIIQIIEDTIQIVIPIIILILYIALVIKIIKMKKTSRNKTEIIILKQAFFIFLMFQIYNIIVLYGKTLKMTTVTAFYLKRAIHTAEIFAGATTPCFVFFTSKEIKKLVSNKITAGSQGNSVLRNRIASVPRNS